MKDVTKHVGQQIKKYRQARKMTQKELGFKIGVKHNTISSYESGINEPEQNTLFALAEVFGISINDFFPSVDTPADNLLSLPPDLKPIPILGEIACGSPIDAQENVLGYRYEVSDYVPQGRIFYLYAKGDSMFPSIPDGSLVMIREQPDVESGEIAAVLLNNDTTATLKRVKKQGDILLLMPDNKNYEPIIVTKANPCTIVGKALKYTFEF